MGDEQDGLPKIDVQFTSQGIVIEGVDVELPAFIAARLRALTVIRNLAQERLRQEQRTLDMYGQGVCDGMGLTADGTNVTIDLDTMTYRRVPKQQE